MRVYGIFNVTDRDRKFEVDFLFLIAISNFNNFNLSNHFKTLAKENYSPFLNRHKCINFKPSLYVYKYNVHVCRSQNFLPQIHVTVPLNTCSSLLQKFQHIEHQFLVT